MIRWAYGVTTVPSRLETTLPRTLKSLANAGFDSPRLFIDGAQDDAAYRHLGLPTTCRYPALRTAHNWTASLYELYLREPDAERFAIFQDDVVLSRNVKRYLDKYTYGRYNEPCYWNLHSFPCNEELRPSGLERGFYESNQLGKSALALVFSRDAVVKLLANEYTIMRPQDLNKGYQSVDGGIVSALKNVGYKERVHWPSLTQHIGQVSSMGHPEYPQSQSFRGEDFDCMELLKCSEPESNQPSKELVSIVAGFPVG